MGNIKFRRAIVPEDAVNMNLEVLEMADASEKLACVAIYGRFRLKSGSFSCQLLFAKSKLIPSGTTQPRAELIAAGLNASGGHTVYLALRDFIVSRLHLKDSQIVLFWITNTKLQMKKWVRNRVIEIIRLTCRDRWFHIDGKNMTADLSTRKGVTLDDISEDSVWVNCHEWAKSEEKDFPIRSAVQIRLSSAELKQHNDECLVPDNEWVTRQLALNDCPCYAAISDGKGKEIRKRYQYSNYLIDPNKFRFRKVVRVMTLVRLFIKKLKKRVNAVYHSNL